MKVDNAIIMAAGTSSRFVPLSYERHKGLTVVRGEVLIERQIKQLLSAGIKEIVVVTGYKSEQFNYLVEKYGIKLIYNPYYLTRNNNSSIWMVRDYLRNSYVCSADNYFENNPFESVVDNAYYAAVYSEGRTEEWCMTEDKNGYINSVTIGGENSWYMLGHTFWSAMFSKEFLRILCEEYYLPQTKDKLWEKIFIEHLDTLKMKIRKYPVGDIYEFDTLDELRQFDISYVRDTRSSLLKSIVKEIGVKEEDIFNIKAIKSGCTEALGFEFDCPKGHFKYAYTKQNKEGD